MRQLQLFGFFALIVALAACGQSSQIESKKDVKAETSGSWISLDESDYSIQYPDTFNLDRSGQMGLSFILLSNQISQQDSFRENINLLIQDLSGQNIDLDKYVEISEEQIKTMITDGNLILSQRLTHKNKAFQKVIYTGKQGRFDLKWQQLYWVENKKAYVLTLTCELNQYDKYVSVAEDIMKTFVIK
ncbi:hypothetical protein ACT3CD_14900 [Geofilum sp. OHC36d9]|uniref:hypothetical protein n=1 Tax=Geofilum sp. OHC36d9 TaxID=3458413 RepID=UPI00403318AE